MANANKKGPCLPDIKTLIQAGINPKTGLPLKFTPAGMKATNLKNEVRRIFRVVDEQRAINRYKWYNLPLDISSQEVERLLYYKGTLCFFYLKSLDKFYLMPYALDGTIDFYGRFNTIHPVPMTSGAEKDEEKTKAYKEKAALLSTLKLNVIKSVVLYEDELTDDLFENSAVILRDYTNQLGQDNTPRYLLNDCLYDVMADCVPFMRTSLLLGTGIQGMRVPDADSYSEVIDAADKMYECALTGNPYVPITSQIEFQELQPSSALKAAEYMLALQSIDNLVLATYGIQNGGVYEKKAHVLESEEEINQASTDSPLQDGLSQRQNFCAIVNSIWGTAIWCEISENVAGDTNGDGVTYDENEGAAQSGVESHSEGGEE